MLYCSTCKKHQTTHVIPKFHVTDVGEDTFGYVSESIFCDDCKEKILTARIAERKWESLRETVFGE